MNRESAPLHSTAALQQVFRELARRLRAMAEALDHPGTPPDEPLLTDLRAAREAFDGLLLALEPAPLTPLTSLVDIVDWERAHAGPRQALKVLRKIQRLVHREDPDWEPLGRCRDQARHLARQLASETVAVDSIEGAIRAFELLLELLEADESGQDAASDALSSFKVQVPHPLVMAALRGKIELSPEEGNKASEPFQGSTIPEQMDAAPAPSAQFSHVEAGETRVVRRAPRHPGEGVKLATTLGKSQRGRRLVLPSRVDEVTASLSDPARALFVPANPGDGIPRPETLAHQRDPQDQGSDPACQDTGVAGPEVPLAAMPDPSHECTGTVSPEDLGEPVGAAVEDGVARSFPRFNPTFSADLLSLKSFRETRALDASGQIMEAPWLLPDFREALTMAAETALRELRLAELWLFARASELQGWTGLPATREVSAAIELLHAPDRQGSGVLPDRSSSLLSVARAEAEDRGLRLAVALEALRPNLDHPIPSAEVERVVSVAGFGAGPIFEFLVAALGAGAVASSPLEVLRQHVMRKRVRPDAMAPLDLEATRERLRHSMKQYWNAAGGRLDTNHCKDAWNEFMLLAQPIIERILRGDEQPDHLKQALDRLEQEAQELFDRRHAARMDRNKMDKTLRSLLDDAREVVFTRRRSIAQQTARDAEKHNRGLTAAFDNLEAVRGVEHGPDRWLLRLLDAILEQGAALRTHGYLTLDQVMGCPALLASLPSVALEPQPGDGVLLDVRQIRYPLEAASLLLGLTARSGESREASALLQSLADAHPQFLVHFDKLEGGLATRASEDFDRLQVEAHRLLGRLNTVLNDLRHLGTPLANELAAIAGEARRVVEQDLGCEAPPGFVLAWLEQSVREATEIRDALGQSVIREMERSSPDRARLVAEEIARGRFAQALAHQKSEPIQSIEGQRSLLWRDEALEKWSTPLAVLKKYSGEADGLVKLWLKGTGNERQAEELRRAFADFFITLNRAKSEIKPRATDIGIPCKLLREWIARDHLNPSFVPQLAQFVQLVVATPRVSPEADNFVQDTANMVAKDAQRLNLLLVPRLGDGVRRNFLAEARRRSLTGVALLDDLDLCRLLNPGEQVPNPLLGVVEILLEQAHKWVPLSPFESGDGQHTKPEMYVGRRQEARALANTATHTRIFSGRRLGKSALLKSVVDNYDGEDLPSRNKLRVLYVPAVGRDTEEGIVDEIATVMQERLGYGRKVTGGPGQRLEALIRGYLEENPKESLLIFLDEADQFVEAEIAAYDRQHESRLTWLMRSRLESDRDSQGLPRVRFVFSGYRATRTSDGAWANWGDVLQLKPLEPEDAVKLIAGPLERMGIRVGSAAADIAWRCGYQPAVLLRFGRQLLEHLDKLPAARREGLEIREDDIALIFANDEVQREIRTVVANNFHGNRLGKIVFAAVLLAFKEIPPGGVLEDAPTRVMETLAELAPDFQGFVPTVGSAYDQIASLLRDFVWRSLLEAIDSKRHIYRLKFPYHLQVLLHEDQNLVIQGEIRALGDRPISEQPTVKSALEFTAMEEIRFALSPEGRPFGVRAVATCSQWPESIVDKRGLGYRLGFSDADLVTIKGSLAWKAFAERERLLVVGVGPDEAQHLLDRRAASLAPPLLLGGADLLRWGLRRERKDAGVIVAAVGRLDAVQLQWWFERVRCIEFSGFSPYRNFIDSTGGIPLLVGCLDRVLLRRVSEGGTVNEQELGATFQDFAAEWRAQAQFLQTGAVGVRLQPRELELLRMASLACRHVGGPDLVQDLVDWATVMEMCDVPAFDPLSPGSEQDEVALEVLIRLGLLRRKLKAFGPLASDQLDVLPAEDMLHQVVDALRP